MTEVINDILKCNRKIYLSITGGGTRAISELLENGGASSVFDGARVPYSRDDLADFIGSVGRDEKCCSPDMAERMAVNSRCIAFANDNKVDEIVGLGCTASLCRHKGERVGRVNQAFICVINTYKIMAIYVEFHNNDKCHTLGRRDQEDMLSTLILSALADFVNPSSKYCTSYIQSHIESNPYVEICANCTYVHNHASTYVSCQF